MDAFTRTVIAYVAGRLITGREGWAIRDHDRNRRVCLDGSVEAGEIKIYSHERHGYISGLGNEGRYALFVHRGASSITLTVNLEERTFSGVHHKTTFRFFGNVSERAIRLYDYQDMHWHMYTL